MARKLTQNQQRSAETVVTSAVLCVDGFRSNLIRIGARDWKKKKLKIINLCTIRSIESILPVRHGETCCFTRTLSKGWISIICLRREIEKNNIKTNAHLYNIHYYVWISKENKIVWRASRDEFWSTYLRNSTYINSYYNNMASRIFFH